MESKISRKSVAIAEIVGAFCLLPLIGILLNKVATFFRVDGLWVGVLTYLITASIILFYVAIIEKKSISTIGLKAFSVSAIPKGLLLGVCMFVAQQIPLLLMGMDYSAFAEKPNWMNIIVISLYCFFCVGFTEELIFRGFILEKSKALCNNKAVIIAINCVLFYAVHMPPIRFIFGEFFNITVNTLLLSIYLYKSKDKSIVPLIIAHGFYDILNGYLLPAFLFYMYG